MSLERQLFLSKRLVTESGVFDGGVCVNENGIIEEVLTRDKVEEKLAEYKDKIKIIDGGDLVLLAGVFDSHVHINEPGRTAWEGFRTATEAAASGGITTVVDMPLNSIPPTTTIENLKIKANAARGNTFVDVGFWGGVIPGNQNELKNLVKAGVVGFKCFLCPSGVDEFPKVERDDLEMAFAELEGTGSLLAFHAEVECNDLAKDNDKDPEEYSTYLSSRPTQMELDAVSLITSLLPKTNVRVHIVHVSSSDVIPILEKARIDRTLRGNEEWQQGITAETCHHYLTLSADQVPRGKGEYKCSPPIRDKQNQDVLWKYLLDDKINLVVSDHSPCTPELKSANYLESWGGISSVQFGLSLFWTSAKKRNLKLEAISHYLSWAPAKLCKLDHRKGSIKPGRDADLIFFDPDATFVVTEQMIRHKNKLSSYIGMELCGVVKKTYLRGQLIYSNGNIIGEPKGSLLLNS